MDDAKVHVSSPQEEIQLATPIIPKSPETKPKRPKSFITPPADKLGIGAIILMHDATSNEWQTATVRKYDPARGQHYLQFEDSSEEWISLLKLKIDKDWRLQVCMHACVVSRGVCTMQSSPSKT